MLQKEIIAKMHELMKTKGPELPDYRVIVGEFQRQTKKELTDDDVLAVLKKLKKSEVQRLESAAEETSPFLVILNEWLPAEISEDSIRAWIAENVDFSQLRNKMQAVGLVTKHFGKTVDGGLVKNIVQSM